MNIMKKLFSSLFVITLIIFFALHPLLVYGGLFGAGNVSGKVRAGVNDFIENDLNVNVHDALRPMTEGINAGDRKGQIPEVTIRFSTPNPKPGEIITATADVTGIANINDAYYIWYIKGPKRIPDEAAKDTRNPEHIMAVRAQALLYFDPLTFDQPMNGGNNNGIVEDSEWPQDKDDDGFKAPMGGGNMKGDGTNYCYIYDIKTGEQYELAKPGEWSSGCPDGYVPRCMVNDSATSCPVVIPGMEGNIDTSAQAESDANTGIANTEANTQATMQGNEGARMRPLARCLDTDMQPVCRDGKLACPTADGDLGTNYNYNGVPNVPTPYCLPKNSNTGQIWTDPYLSGCPSAQSPYVFEGEPTGEEGDYIDGPDDRTRVYGTGCFEYLEYGTILKPDVCDLGESTGKSCSSQDFRPVPPDTGDGTFTREEEMLYHLNPLTSRTTPLAPNDEALAVGFGQREFTWRYQEGDEIGVIVEGIGLEATKHEDASYQTIYALLDPACDDVGMNANGAYNEMVKNKAIHIKTAGLTDEGFYYCIEENNLYVKPGTSEYDALNVTVSSNTGNGASQAAVPSGLSQPMKITAHAGQTQGGSISNPTHLYYDWSLTCDTNGKDLLTDEEWTKQNLTSQKEGMNIPALEFTANFPQECFDGNGQGSVTAKAKINEPRKGGGSNFGQSETQFHIYNVEDNPLKTYKTQTTNETQFQKTNTQICDEGIDKTVCRVMNNEVIAIEAEGAQPGMVSWKINNKPYHCDATVSQDCTVDGKGSNTIIFPVNGIDGDMITVTATINDVTSEKNQAQTITRVYRVTDPQVTIIPVAGATPKVLGVYEDLDDNQFLDESTSTLEAIAGDTVTLKADLYPGFLNNNTDTTTYEWFVNGESYTKGPTLSFVPEGQYTTVAVKAIRDIGLDERLALEEGLGITQQQTIPETLTSSIQIETKENTAVATNGTNAFFATVAHNTPEYLLFLLKMTLVVGIMLFIPSLVLGVGRENS